MQELWFQLNVDNRVPTRSLESLFPGVGGQAISIWGEARPFLENRLVGRSTSLLTPLELATVCAITRYVQPRMVFEIGTARGGTAYNLSLNAPPGAKIYSLDIGGRADRLPAGENMTYLEGESGAFSYEPWKGLCDLVFIDGDHREAGVRKDSENALSLLGTTGAILWHDFEAKHPGVVKVVQALAETLPISRIAGTSLAIYLKGREN